MTPALLVVLAAGLAGLSGAPALASGSRTAERIATALALAASAAGIAGSVLVLLGGPSRLAAAWALRGAALRVEVDALSALFLIPLFLVSGLGSVYGLGYWPAAEHPRTSRTLRLFYGLCTAGIAVVFVARNAVLFLGGWEVMALAAFFLVGTEAEKKRVREASWIYLVATHTATLALFGLFSLLRAQSGSFDLVRLPAGIAPGPVGTALFWLAIVGFGTKAGLMPLHVWLPGAHAAAPSHVSALMSGVLIKTGVYGLVRILGLFPDPPLWWGGTLLLLGTLSGVLGVAFALGQHDLKRLLAYHSVENVGIIVMGVGLGFLGVTRHEPLWMLLGFGGGLLHVVNHALFKSLLFLGAGAVVHATGTREMDRLGGLLKRMPRTGLLFLVGAVAICGLPPLNGFVSELLVYLGLVGTLQGTGARFAPFAAPLLALIGGLAVSCFVKAFGAVFLGEPRTGDGAGAHDRPLLTAPMGVLALCCAAIGLVPVAVAPLVEKAASAASASAGLALPPLRGAAPLGTLGIVHAVLAAALGAGFLMLRARVRAAPRAVTWDCGYAAPTPRMQYTASSFARWSVGFFRWGLRPHVKGPRIERLFPREAAFTSHVPETVLERVFLPLLARGQRLLSRARSLQEGHVQLYLVYIAAALLALLLWAGR